MVGDGGPGRKRVLVDDARRNGQFLRLTWHRSEQQFVLSNWDGPVCVGATRVPVVDAPAVMAVLAEGLADAAARPSAPPEPRTLRQHLRAWWALRSRRAPVVRLPNRPATDTSSRRSA